jgi:Response regulator receiver domain
VPLRLALFTGGNALEGCGLCGPACSCRRTVIRQIGARPKCRRYSESVISVDAAQGTSPRSLGARYRSRIRHLDRIHARRGLPDSGVPQYGSDGTFAGYIVPACCWPTIPATAEQLRELLQPHFDVVALVGDGRALVSAAARLSPDVIVADISMPSLDGIDAAAEIRRCNPAARIGLVTVHAEAILLERGL